MQDRNWFMHPPFDFWLSSVVSLIIWKASHGCNYDEILVQVKDHGPLKYWDNETEKFVELATKIAVRDANG